MKHIYQLKIELKDSNPKIWRRIQISEDTLFSDLHDIIQLTMGWENNHLYWFIVDKTKIYDFEDVFDDGENPFEKDSASSFLNEVVHLVRTRFTYVYDFGDHWEHVISVEKILPDGKNDPHPVCVGGEGACPPEDCGGIWRYQEILRILKDTNHPEHDDVVQWIDKDWDAELFDCARVNALLKDYAEQWEDIFEETGEILEKLEGGETDLDDWDDVFYDEDEDNEYEELKKFSNPEDVLQDDVELYNMKVWLKTKLEDEKTIEHEASRRLKNLGYGKKAADSLILETLAIEWFYDLKYETGHLEDRYEYNIRHLPEVPQEISRLKDALDVLDKCIKDVPFYAIEYLKNESSVEATSAIIKALRNHSDHQYCWADCTMAPFFYALAAEGHLCEELIEPVIELYEDGINSSDWLNEQGQYLIGKLAEKYPGLTAEKVLVAMEKDVNKKTKPDIYFLFDAFYFADLNNYKPRLLLLLERADLYWLEPLATTIAILQIKEGLPVLQRKLEKLNLQTDKDVWHKNHVKEIKEAIKILKGEIILGHDQGKPLSLTRTDSWKDNLRENENNFYGPKGDTNNYSFPNIFDRDISELSKWSQLYNPEPYIAEKTPGRNDPCHCGSGKKYKKCCMDKDK